MIAKNIMKPIEFVCGQNWVDQAENNRRDYHPTLASNADEHGWDMLNWVNLWRGSREGDYVWRIRWTMMCRCGVSEQKTLLR